MRYRSITDQDRAKRTLQELQILEQNKLNIYLLLSRVNADIFILKVENKELHHHQAKKSTLTIFQKGDLVQITNNLRDEFEVFFEVIKVSENNYRVFLEGYNRKTRYQRSPKRLHMVTFQECVEFYKTD